VFFSEFVRKLRFLKETLCLSSFPGAQHLDPLADLAAGFPRLVQHTPVFSVGEETVEVILAYAG
jgi:hypothetical protein